MNTLLAAKHLPRKCYSLALAIATLLPSLGITSSAVAADRIYASYSALERSISVAALEAYARDGTIDEDLAVYAQYVPPEQLLRLQKVLLQRIKLSPVAVSQFLYTKQGEVLLERLGEVIKTESRQPGSKALRAALILAASDQKEGLTLLNFLRKFPTRSIRIDLASTLAIAGQLERLVNQTNKANNAVAQTSLTKAETKTPDVSLLKPLISRGPLMVRVNEIPLYDPSRKRVFQARVFLPSQQTPAPVIVISHGLGTDPSAFNYFANHLASYGFAIAVPNHPGSDAKQLEALLSGRATQVAEPNEFIDRPLDVKFLLNELEDLNKTNPTFKGRMNLQQVGVVGQSFGGYTALALAGATLNWEQVNKDCTKEATNDVWNVSLLLQCRIQEANRTAPDLSDPRIKAVMAINPITSTVFGQEGLSKIQIPVMIMASSDDTIAPSLSEQIRPFTWLTSPQKYLSLLKGGTHFSTIALPNNNSDPVPLPPQVIGVDPNQARRYLNNIGLSFFKTYVGLQPQYLPYLSSAYAETISQGQPLGLSLIDALTPAELDKALED